MPRLERTGQPRAVTCGGAGAVGPGVRGAAAGELAVLSAHRVAHVDRTVGMLFLGNKHLGV